MVCYEAHSFDIVDLHGNRTRMVTSPPPAGVNELGWIIIPVTDM